MGIDDELRDLMRRAEETFGEAVCAAAMDRALELAHRARRRATADDGGVSAADAGVLPPGAFEQAFKAELTRMLRPQ